MQLFSGLGALRHRGLWAFPSPPLPTAELSSLFGHASMPWVKQRSPASSRKSCLWSPREFQFPWKHTGHDHPFTFNWSPKNQFPFICWCLCIHQRGKGTEAELGRAGTKELRSRRKQQYPWNTPFHLSTRISYQFLLPKDFSGKFYSASLALFYFS